MGSLGRARRLGIALAIGLACASTPDAPLTVYPMLEPGDTDPAAGYEAPRARRASELWPPETLRGEHHEVAEEVASDGFAHIYQIRSDFGDFRVFGDAMLETRVREIRALAALEQVRESERFAAAAVKGLASPFVGAWSLIRNPVDTVVGVPAGAWREIQRAASRAGRERSEYEARAFAEFIGFEDRKRELAAHLGVDPYSSNAILQRELNRHAWASYVGGLPFVLIPRPPETEARAAAVMPYDSPEDLRRLNRIELIAMGVESELAERFLSHRWFSPRHQTRFVSALAGLELASGRRALVEAALHARSEYDAIFYQSAAELLEGYALEHPIRRLAPVNRIAVGVTEAGEVVVPLRVDHAVWTRPVEAWAEDVLEQATRDLDAKRVVVLLTGTISPKAREEFAARALEVRERAGRAP